MTMMMKNGGTRKRKVKKRTRSLRVITLIYSRKMKVLLLNHRLYPLLRNRLPKHPLTRLILGIPPGESGPGTRGKVGNGMVERIGNGRTVGVKTLGVG